MIDLVWKDDIAEIERTAWNRAVRRDALYLRHEHLSALQSAEMDIVRFRYLLFTRGGEPLAVAFLYCIDTPLSVFLPRRLEVDRILAEAHSGPAIGRRPFAVRTIECGLPTAVGQAVSIREAVYAPQVWKRLFDAMWAFADEMGCKTLIVRDLPPETAGTAHDAAGKGGQLVRFFPNARLAVRWESWDDYVKSLRKRYRQHIRQNEAAMAQARIAVEHRQHFADLADELFALYAQVYARATELRRERLTPAYFASIDRELGDRASVLLYRQGEKLVAFDILFEDEDTLRCLYTGLDYSANQQGRLYFNLYYDDVRMAIKKGLKWVEWGLGSYPTKLALGAEISPMQILLMHRRPIVASFLKTIFSATQSTKPFPAYRVFRDGHGGAET